MSVDFNLMTKKMISGMPDLTKPRTRDKLYVYTGIDNDKGYRYMADYFCTCGGRGFKGKNLTTGKYEPCKCIRVVQLPIDFVVLPKEK